MINTLLTQLSFSNKINMKVDQKQNQVQKQAECARNQFFQGIPVNMLQMSLSVCEILIFLRLQGSQAGPGVVRAPQPLFLGREQSHASTCVPYTYCYFSQVYHDVKKEWETLFENMRAKGTSCLDGDRKKSHARSQELGWDYLTYEKKQQRYLTL